MFFKMRKFRLLGRFGNEFDETKNQKRRSIEFRFSFAMDILDGLSYLHSRHIIHGRLNSSNCLVDQRLTIKLTGKFVLFIFEIRFDRSI